jgi:HAD superfamily hydrolase (TIGR01459 family)
MTRLRFVDHLRELVTETDVILSDIWGVIHDGLTGFPGPCHALRTFREQGGTVILITNAPRPADSVQAQLRDMKIADETYDAIVSSGDLTRHYVASHVHQSLFQIGPNRDSPVFNELDVTFAPLEKADYIVCTGLFDDENETAEDYRDLLSQALARKLTLICANPDIVVERGHKMIPCAGAIAELYREMGGDVIFYGKPHPPIYERALELAAAKRGKTTPVGRILAIGDSVRTDLTGANTMGLNCLFVTRGIHAEEFENLGDIDDAKIKQLFGGAKPPLALTRDLKW